MNDSLDATHNIIDDEEDTGIQKQKIKLILTGLTNLNTMKDKNQL